MTNRPWNQSEPEQPDDSLDRALLAIRSEPAPDGPSGELVADTLAALERAAVDHERPIPLFRKVLTVRNLEISAGVLSAAAAAVLLAVALTPSSRLFADAIESIRKAHTLSASVVTVAKETSETKIDGKEIKGKESTLSNVKGTIYDRDDGSVRFQAQLELDLMSCLAAGAGFIPDFRQIVFIYNAGAKKAVVMFTKAKMFFDLDEDSGSLAEELAQRTLALLELFQRFKQTTKSLIGSPS